MSNSTQGPTLEHLQKVCNIYVISKVPSTYAIVKLSVLLEYICLVLIRIRISFIGQVFLYI